MSGSIVIAPEFIFISVFALAVLAATVVHMVRSRVRGQAQWAMAAMIVCGALGLFVKVPAVYHGLDDLVGVPNLAVLVSFWAYIACAVCMHLWVGTWPSTALTVVRGTPRNSTIGMVFIGGVVLLSLLFAAGAHPDEEAAGYFVLYAHDAATRAMVFGFFGIYDGLWVWIIIRIHRVRIASSAGGIRWLGSGLALLEASIVVDFLYPLVVAGVCASTVTGARGASWMLVADCIDIVGSTLGCTALVCRVWGPQLERLFGAASGKQTARMQYRQLRTLRRLVGSGASVRMRRGLGLQRRDPRMALAYQVCAIVEGRKQLAGYRDEGIESVAAEWGQVLAEVIRLAAAARACPPRGSATPAAKAPSHPDLSTELRRSLRLASALTMLQTLHNTGEYGRFAAAAGHHEPSLAG